MYSGNESATSSSAPSTICWYELSSEIDLHYEDDELPGHHPTIEKMRNGQLRVLIP